MRFSRYIGYFYIFLDSSMVEHSAVNRVVVGSSPTRGADKICEKSQVFFLRSEIMIMDKLIMM